MAALVFRLNDVPADEADDVRQLLEQHHIEFYETSAGRWGFSVVGIWVKSSGDKPRARELIDAYQQERFGQPASEPVDSLWQRFMENPLRFIIYLAIVVAILYLSIVPFTNIGK